VSNWRRPASDSHSFGGVFDLARKENEVRALEEQTADPEFWADPAQAQQTMRRLTALREEVRRFQELEQGVQEALALLDLAEAEEDEALLQELEREAARLTAAVDRLESELMLSGPYDQRAAILAIHAGAGGTESQDWAQMLLRMYLRWAERRGFRTEILDLTPGEEAGIKSVTVEIEGPYAYGYLKSERGVHRLVRISPFDAAHRRHTSFALVEVLPEVEENIDVTIDPDDLRIDVFRASGPGGQNVQKNSTAVRIVHLPTGITVSCQSERSLAQNRETALKILRARLIELRMRQIEEEKARLKGEHVAAGWGNQIRSYVLHPYTLVKDHRTGYETSDATAVLDGELDDLILAYLRSQIGAAA